MTSMKALIAAILSLGSVAIAPTAEAQRYDGGGYGYQQPYRGHDSRYDGWGYDARDGWGYDARYDGRGYDDRRYDGHGYYDARADRRCRNGATGAVLGALVGGLFGRAIDDRGDHATGTILGAAGGALAGRAVERSGNQGYCR